MINAIGNILGGGSAKISYAKKLAKAYEARVIADGGVVESLGCFTAFATALGAYQPPIALAATGIGEISFTANWKPFKGAKYYLLDVSTSPTFATFVYENEIVPAPTTSYVVIGLNSNTTYYYRVRASTTFDADYQAVLNYATTQGYTLPSAGQQVLQNQLLVDLKSAGIWSKLDTFAVFATDGDEDFALIDWIRLTQYTAFNSPTFTTNDGFLGNGSSSYIDTNFNPFTSGVNFTLNDASFGGVKNIIVSNTAWFAGTEIFGENFLRGSGSSLHRINQGSSNFTTLTNTSEFNFIAIHRNSFTTGAISLDSIIDPKTDSVGSLDIPNSNQLILRSGTTYANYGARMYFSGANLISENTDFFNAWNNYYTSL